ncbi:MAG: exodeoxyribonuclease III [Anaerolineales bacterium]|nr:exodeoxyribonuclease III [Anaerolineales bacterium]
MRLVTWNVNGLRSLLKRDGWNWIARQKPDVVCHQEIKVMPEQLTASQLDAFKGYEAVWNPAEKPGYSGVATLTRGARAAELGFGQSKFDTEGRLIQTHFDDFELLNVYFPSGTSGMHRVEFKLEFYAALLEYIKALRAKGKSVIITGDFNTAHTEIDLARPKTNQRTSGFMPIEREALGHYFESGLVDSFRRLNPDKVQYTWWTQRSPSARANNIGWRLDYFLVSEDLFPKVKAVTIFDDVTGSDHCPVMLELK